MILLLYTIIAIPPPSMPKSWFHPCNALTYLLSVRQCTLLSRHQLRRSRPTMENGSNNVANGAGASPPQRRRREDLRILVGPFHYDIAKDDRISTLPDEVMQDIFRRLPIGEAARVAAVSRRWNLVWNSLLSPIRGP